MQQGLQTWCVCSASTQLSRLLTYPSNLPPTHPPALPSFRWALLPDARLGPLCVRRLGHHQDVSALLRTAVLSSCLPVVWD